MDFNLKQWRHDSEQQQQQEEGSPSLKLPKLEPNYSQQHYHQTEPCSELPLFVPDTTSNLSAYHSSSDHIPNSTPTKFQTRMGSCFNFVQWQELELQALIFRHMIAGAPVPPELLLLVKKSIITSNPPPYFLSNSLQQVYYPHFQPALVQSGYWGRGVMDPEPGRCRRTDGKKWRCSRDVVTGQKYCERHVHRGRNRSRKPVENATTNTNAGDSIKSVTTTTNSTITSTHQGMVTNEVVPHFTLSGPSPSMDLLQLSRRPSDSMIETKSPFEAQDGGARTLRRFFDDWPRSLHDGDSSTNASATNLSISMPGNSSSDFALKLSTGDGEESVARGERERSEMNWASTWEAHPAAPMGGPLAEALRSSTSSNSSPTSVLHRLQRGSISETSYVSQ